MSWRPLAELSVGALGSSRALRFAARTLAALGADVVRIAPPGVDPPPAADPAHGGASERESRLAAWLDADVDVVAAPAGAVLGDLAATGLGDVGLVLCDAALAGAAPAGAPVIRVGLAAGDSSDPACGLTAAARAGVAVAIGAPEREPLGLPFDLADHATGLVAVVAGLHALDAGADSGDVDAVRVLATFAGVNGLVYEPYGIPWTRARRRASQCGGPYPYGFWRASDGFVCAIGRSRSDWERLLDALGRPAWSRDERYANLRRNGAEHADELDALIEPWSSQRTRAELQEIAEQHSLALAPVRSAQEVLEDRDLLDGGFLRRPATGGFPAPGPATVPADTPADTPAGAADDAGTQGPLAGARVLDFGWVWSAPLVGAGLADMGADVVKVEHAKRPDNSRLRGRPDAGWLERDDADSLESVPYFLNLNHGKRSLGVDLKDPDGAAVARRLLERADIVVENLGEPVFRRLGLHYDDVADANPGLIWLSMTTRRCGSAEMRGYAPTISSFSGLESAIGYPGDLTGMMTFGLCDPIAGSWGLLAVLTAWRERARTGRGRLLRLGQLEGFIALLGEQLEQADREGATPPAGNTHPYFHPYGCYRTADDRHVAIAALDDGQRARLAAVLGTPATTGEALDEALRDRVAARSAADVVGELRGIVACELVATYAEARADTALRDAGMLAEVDHPLVGRHLVYTQPWRLDGEAVPVGRAAPTLGAHTDDIIEDWLGYSPAVAGDHV